MRKEKRKYLRITPSKKAFSSIGATFSGICKIEDISMNGIGISCVSDIAPNGFDRVVNLFLPDENIQVGGLPCKIVYQNTELLPVPSKESQAQIKRFRCGIVFEDLKKTQIKALSDFVSAL